MTAAHLTPNTTSPTITQTSSQHTEAQRNPTRGSEALEKLEEALETACTLGGWREYLKVQARFHRYSFRNTLMILNQRPTASKVAGFHDWLKVSRHVNKGEKGITILAPLKWSKLDEETGETKSGVKGFKIVFVFDITQTDGEPLPERPIVSMQDGPNAQAKALTITLRNALEIDGLPVKFADLEPGHFGSFNRLHHVITLSNALEDVQRLSTLVHETAHAKLHAHPQLIPLEDQAEARALREFEAESVACVVLEHVGISITSWSANYLASYGMNPEHLTKIGSRVQACAAQIIQMLEPRTQDQADELKRAAQAREVLVSGQEAA